jgi:hypothetical protein
MPVITKKEALIYIFLIYTYIAANIVTLKSSQQLNIGELIIPFFLLFPHHFVLSLFLSNQLSINQQNQ